MCVDAPVFWFCGLEVLGGTEGRYNVMIRPFNRHGNSCGTSRFGRVTKAAALKKGGVWGGVAYRLAMRGTYKSVWHLQECMALAKHLFEFASGAIPLVDGPPTQSERASSQAHGCHLPSPGSATCCRAGMRQRQPNQWQQLIWSHLLLFSWSGDR